MVRTANKDELEKKQSDMGTHFYGRFLNGQVVGSFWIGLIRNGYIHGIADENGRATGDDLSFIYPDGVTALKGRFENRFMKKARHVDVEEYTCDENGMFVVKQFSQPLSEDEFFYDPPTNESFGGGPTYIEDPYEKKTVELAPSSIPQSGEGVFLKRDIPQGRISCFYSLYLYRGLDQIDDFKAKYLFNTSKSDDYRRQCKKYSLGLRTYHGMIDLLPELDVNPLPNLGPKVNHNFKFNNSGMYLVIDICNIGRLILHSILLAYMEAEHPRWGLIQSVVSQVALKAGSEVFTHYGYTEDKRKFPGDFPWYWEAKEALDKEDELKEKENIKESKRNSKQKKYKKKTKIKK